MICIEEKNKCCGCSACAHACPQNCIQMIEDEEGFLYPTVDQSQCINCGICDQSCPFQTNKQQKQEMKAYAVKAKDYNVRISSSSGGVFTVIAQNVINQGGVVFGAVLSDDCRKVYHALAVDIKELDRLKGSKYLQSDICDTYDLAKKYLNQGKKVLFSGTPCQISGLKLFLKKKYDNLLTIEIVCHGVPSPLFWRKYVESAETTYKSKLVKINFRAKNEGWKQFGLEEKYENGTTRFSNLKDNFFLKIFLKNYCLRPSCYECKTRCVSDLILGDLWGSQEIISEMDDDKGISLVLINSSLGRSVMEEIEKKVETVEIDLDSAVKYNPSIYSSVPWPNQRGTFFNNLQILSFEKFEKKYNRLLKKKEKNDFVSSMVYYAKRLILSILQFLKLHK